jgi:glycine cleavage system H protein
MDAIQSFFETAGIAVVGILIRLLIAVAGLAILAFALAAVFMGWEGVKRLVDRARGVMHAGALTWQRGFFYSPGHTWLAAERDGSVRVGLDDLAQKVLPGARVLQFAPVGGVLKKGEALAQLLVGNHRLTIGAPTSGRVVAVNERLGDNPSLLHLDPYRRGWLAAIAPSARDFESYPTGSAAQSWIRREDHRLNGFLEAELGIAAADGGEWIVPPATMLTEKQFEALAREFLAAK